MRAAVSWEAGVPFALESGVQRREPTAREVVVRVRAAGFCQTDLSLSKGAFGQAHPVVLGHEGVGEVIEVGSAVRSVSTGSRVIISWVPSCGRCYHCVRGESYICAERKRAGDRDPGDVDLSVDGRPVHAGMGTATFAEETVLPESAVIPLDDDIPFELAALLGCAVPTGLGAALNSAAVSPGETVQIIGCGAVGLSAVQGARIAGASLVVAVDPHPARRATAETLGADIARAPGDDLASQRPHGVGFDVVIDAVARSTTIRSGWTAARRGGRVVVVGAGHVDDPVEFSALELFHDEKTIRGSFYGSSDMKREVPRLTALWRSGRLDLQSMVADVVALDDINEVARRQGDGEVVRLVMAP